MKDLTIKGNTELFGIEVPNIYGGFGSDQKAMLVKNIAEIHDRQAGHVNELINKNRSRFINGIHIIDLKGSPEAAIVLTDSQIMGKEAINASKNIYALSQRGYTRLLKIMDDDTAWEKWDKVENDYFELKEAQVLPRMTQVQIVAFVAKQQAEQEQQISQLGNEIKGIREVVALCPNDWRKDTSSLIRKMAQNIGGNEHIRDLHNEAYSLLDERMGVDVKVRLTNKRRRMADEGICKSKRDKLNPLDVIAEDKKLIEGYIAIIKEMSIKYGIGVAV